MPNLESHVFSSEEISFIPRSKGITQKTLCLGAFHNLQGVFTPIDQFDIRETLKGWYYYAHFTAEKTKLQKGVRHHTANPRENKI